MSNRHKGIIDLRKRRAGASVRAARERAQAELPLHHRTSLRTRRRKLRALMAVFVLVAVVGAAYGVSELSYLTRYSIQEVRVEGTGNVSPRLVQAFVETKLYNGTHPALSSDNIFLYPKAAIAQSIQNYFPRIISANISRQSLLAQVITVTIVERKPYALWCSEKSGCFEMDSGGYIFAPSATSTAAGEIVFTGGLATSTKPIGQTFLPDQFADVLAFISRLQNTGYSAASVSIEDEQDFSVSLAKGFVLRASFSEDPSTLVRNLQNVLSSEQLRVKEDKIEYIDLRFGNRVYYKNRN